MLRISKDVQAAKLLMASDFALPDNLAHAIHGNEVVVVERLNPDGSVKCIGLIKDENRLNDEQRLSLLQLTFKAMGSWKYQPTYLNGERVAVESVVILKKEKSRLTPAKTGLDTRIMHAEDR
jgi:hypothetical protein